MMHFVLLEDSSEDAKYIIDILDKQQSILPHKLIHFADLRTGLQHIQNHPVNLLLLDLEFTVENMTASYIIDDIPDNIPILIVSHLTHYQKPLTLKLNVKGFISKNNLSTSLISSIKKIFGLESTSLHSTKQLVFPASNNIDISEAIDIRDIRYIDFCRRKVYTVHLIDGSCKTIYSVSFNELCTRISKQHISSLCPVNKNQIINIDYIKEVEKLDNSRIKVTLINLPHIEFHIGPKHQKPFEIFFN